jgi:hypothetical protein
MKYFLAAVSMILLFGGCSAKEFNEGADDIGKDVSKLFEVRK